MKKGELFETVMRVVQEALKSSDSTRIKQNHKLLDNTGLKREFDIFIESQITNFQVNVAIECKDYKNKVSIEKIEAFQSKCNDVPQIHRKVFISRVGFQSGAETKAKYYGIELLLLEKISEADVLNWLQISVPTLVNINRILTSPSVKFIGKPFNFLLDDTLSIEDKGLEMALLDFIKLVIEQKLANPKIFTSTIDAAKPSVETLKLTIEFSLAFLRQGQLKSQISHLWFNVEHHYTYLKSEISFDKFLDLDGNNEFTQSVTLVSENRDIYSFVKKQGQKEIEIVSKIKIGSKEEIVKIGTMKVEKTNTND